MNTFVSMICIFCLASAAFAQDALPTTPRAPVVIGLRNDLAPMSSLNVDGQPVGFFVDVWKLWSEKTGQPIAFRAAPWQATLDALKNGEIDVIGALYSSEERSGWMGFSQPLYASGSSLYYSKKQGVLQNISELAGQKAGVIGGAVQEQELRKQHPEIEPVRFASLEEMIPAARAGNIRAFVASPASTAAILSRSGLTDEFESMNETLFARKLHASVLKQNSALLTLIDQGFDAISNEELAKIEARWIPDPAQRYYRTSSIIRMTAAENAWLNQHASIRVSLPTDFPPLMFFDEHQRIQGIIPDYLALFSARTGIRFDLTAASVSEFPQQLAARQIDMMPMLMSDAPPPSLSMTEACLTLSLVIVNRLDAPFFRSVRDMETEGLNVALVKDIAVYKTLLADFPKMKLSRFANPIEAMKSVAQGKNDAFIGSLPVIAYLIQQERMLNLKIAGDTGFKELALGFAVRSDFPELTNILNKALHSMTRQEHDQIFHAWLPIRYEQTADWRPFLRWTLSIGGVLTALLGLSLFWNRRLAQEIAERKQAETALRNNEQILHVQNETLQELNEEYQVINEELAQTNDTLSETTRRLTESEERFRAVFQYAPDGFLIADAATQQFYYANPAICKMLGYRLEELLELNVPRIHPEKDWPDVLERFEQLSAGEIITVDNLPVLRKDGSVFYANLSGCVLHINQRQYLLGMFRDMTERRQAEDALRASEQKFRFLTERMNDLIYLYRLRPEPRFEYVSPSAERITGYTLEEHYEDPQLGMKLVHPDDAHLLQPFFNGIVNTAPITIRWRKKDGSIVWTEIENIPLYDDEGELIALQGKATDVTERKKAEAALRESEERLALVLEGSQLGYWDWTISTGQVLRNARWAEMLGYHIQEIEFVVKQWTDLIHPDDRAAAWQSIQDHLEGRTPAHRIEYRMRAKDGQYKWILDQAKIVKRDAQGKPLRMSGTHTDITERKQAEEDLFHAKEAAEAANRAKSRFLASMSHELRTPLNGILGYAQILARDPSLTAQQREKVHTIERSGQHLLNLINDILDLAKIEAGKFDVIETDFALPPLLQEVGALIQMRGSAKGVAFRQEYTALPAVVHGAEHRLRQVLLNLLSNAVKFTERGQVTLRVSVLSHTADSPPFDTLRTSPERDITFYEGATESYSGQPCPDKAVRGTLPSSVIRFEVEDTGVGIAADELANIFEPFRQAGAQEYRIQGAGLGLAISQNLVRLMGGELQVRSQVGVGSVFWFDLPLKEVAASSISSPPKAEQISGVVGTPPTILIVDDEAVNRAYLRDALASVGIRVLEAASGSEGLTLAQTQRPQAIITDIVMPEMDGLEMIRRLRQAQELRGVVIIAASASAYPEDREACRDAGSQAFLSKPIDIDQLFAQLHELLNVQWMYREELDTEHVSPDITHLAHPPNDMLRPLFELAQMGDILELRRQLAALADANAEWQPFLHPLQQLAQQFRLADIRMKLEGMFAQPNLPGKDREIGLATD